MNELANEADDLFSQIKKQGLVKKFEMTAKELVKACLLPPFGDHSFILITELWLLGNMDLEDAKQVMKLYERHIMGDSKTNFKITLFT